MGLQGTLSEVREDQFASDGIRQSGFDLDRI